jgi:hypothetical protein
MVMSCITTGHVSGIRWSTHNPGSFMTCEDLSRVYALPQNDRLFFDNCRNCGAPPHTPGAKCVYCGSGPTPLYRQVGTNNTLGVAR